MSQSVRPQNRQAATSSSWSSSTVNAVRSTFLSSTLRFSLLRIICLSALMASFTALPACVVAFKENHGLRRYALIAVLWPFFVFIHHFARFITQEPSFSASNLLTGVPLVPLVRVQAFPESWMSFFLFLRSLPLVLNAFFLTVLMRRRQLIRFLLTGYGTTVSRRFYIGTSIYESLSYFALLCMLTGCLAVYLLMRFAETIQRSGGNLWTFTDISDIRWSHADVKTSGPSSHLATGPWSGRRSSLEVLSGASIWKARCVCVAI